jgi:hypothetical protein
MAELTSMGIAPSSGPFSRPIYGYATVSNEVMPEFVGSLNPILRQSLDDGLTMRVGRAKNYGEFHFVFGNKTLAESTFTVGDSLGGRRISSPLFRPTPGQAGLASGSYLAAVPRGTGFVPRGGRESFIETQNFLTNLDDVVEVHIAQGSYATAQYIDMLRSAIRSLTGNDIDIRIIKS